MNENYLQNLLACFGPQNPSLSTPTPAHPHIYLHKMLTNPSDYVNSVVWEKKTLQSDDRNGVLDRNVSAKKNWELGAGSVRYVLGAGSWERTVCARRALDHGTRQDPRDLTTRKEVSRRLGSLHYTCGPVYERKRSVGL